MLALKKYQKLNSRGVVSKTDKNVDVWLWGRVWACKIRHCKVI